MVKKIEKLWICESCSFKYATKEIAQKCEDWCKKYKSCNLDIIKQAIK